MSPMTPARDADTDADTDADKPLLRGATGLRCICATHYNEAGLPVIPKILPECPLHQGVHPAWQST